MTAIPMKYAWLLSVLALTACKDPAINVDGERVQSRAGDRPAGQATAAPTAQVKAPTPVKNGHAAAPSIQWDDSISWKTWDEGSKLAKSSGKPIFLLVYANWCPHCKNLKTVFADPEVQKLADKMIMVRQDSDADDAGWLASRVGSFGSYVPRIFFLSADGSVKPELTSGNPKYPYFYTPDGVAQLKASMRQAAGG